MQLRQGRKCAKGHSMDPNWEQCPYCEAEQKSNQKSVVFGAVESADRQERGWIVRGIPAAPQANRVNANDVSAVQSGFLRCR